jgi:hypothetical protein
MDTLQRIVFYLVPSPLAFVAEVMLLTAIALILFRHDGEV